jgi:hypothetical protein
MDWRRGQAVECLLCKHKALSSSPIPPKVTYCDLKKKLYYNCNCAIFFILNVLCLFSSIQKLLIGSIKSRGRLFGLNSGPVLGRQALYHLKPSAIHTPSFFLGGG